MVRICFLVIGAVFICQVHAASTVSGTITDYITTAPIADFQVRLIGISPAAITDSARTGVDGRYSFINVPAGAYQIRLDDSRYATDSTLVTIASDTSFSYSVFDKTHILVYGSVPDTLKKSGSPYLVMDPITVVKPLVISPGVRIMIVKHTSLLLFADVSAIGSPDDSIVFEAKRDSVFFGSICLSKPNGEFRFAYCRFERLMYPNIQNSNLLNRVHYVNFEHCLFYGNYGALICLDPAQKIRFSNNRVVGGMKGIAPLTAGPLADTLEVTDNFIQSTCDCVALGLALQENGKCYVRRNTVMGKAEIDCSRLSTSRNDTVASNIFIDNSFTYASGKSTFFAYNNHNASSNTPLGVGINAMKNAKGDACDVYYNIMRNPLFADSTTGVLLSSSPCIGTGMGGVENMGVYQGPGAGTGVREAMRPHQEVKGTFEVILNVKGNVVTFAWLNPAATDKGSLSVYSASGKLVKRILLSGNQEFAKCDLSGAGPGVYIASFNRGSDRQKIRFAVCR